MSNRLEVLESLRGQLLNEEEELDAQITRLIARKDIVHDAWDAVDNAVIELQKLEADHA